MTKAMNLIRIDTVKVGVLEVEIENE